MKHKHRRHYFWVPFILFSAALFFVFHEDRLPRLLSAWVYGPLIPAPSPQAPAILPPAPAEALKPLEVFRFEDTEALSRWEQKIFKGKTDYRIHEREGGRPYLSATSDNSSCGLFMKVRHAASPELFLSWKWRAREFPQKKDPSRLSNRQADDFAARVYVIFEASNLFRSDVIEYVWDESLPVGTVADSPYSDRIKLVVLRSGSECVENDGWCSELRNPLQDFMKLFGKAPRNPIGILALMSDSDNTGGRAEADFEEILFGSKGTIKETVTEKGEGLR